MQTNSDKDANETFSIFSQNQKLQIKVQNTLNFKVSQIYKFKFQILRIQWST